jgi:hypothetical protein
LNEDFPAYHLCTAQTFHSNFTLRLKKKLVGFSHYGHFRVQITRLPAYARPDNSAIALHAYSRRYMAAPPGCSGSFSNCIQVLCSHLQWQDTQTALCGCWPAAVA